MNADQATFLAEYFANLIEQEARTTARVLAAVPDSKHDYRPDDKSRTAWELATHVALGDLWFLDSIINRAFHFDPHKEKEAVGQIGNVKALVEFYNRELPERVRQLRAMSGEQLTEVVDFFGMMKLPAVAFLGIANNHGIHHRGQLAAYLRAMGSRVPSIYGGSADEPVTAAAN